MRATKRNPAPDGSPGVSGSLPGEAWGWDEEREEESDPSRWAVSWSDLMMVMFVLFVVLFATTKPEPVPTVPPPRVEATRSVGAAEHTAAPAATPVTRVERHAVEPMPEAYVRRRPDPVYRGSLAATAEIDPSRVDVRREADHSIRLRLGGPLLFETGSADLGAPATSLLDRLVPVIAANDRPISVEGHSDDAPIASERYPTNWELSAARAAAVVRYLIDRGDLDPARFRAVGRSSHVPRSAAEAPDAQARNRRVEIIIAAPAAASRIAR